jgi:hypothetical protein
MGEGVRLRVVHASPDAPAVDVYSEGLSAPLVTNLAYGEASGYLDLDPGTYNIQLRAAGSPATSDPAFATGDLTLHDDDVVTAVAVGLLSSTDDADKFRVLPLLEGFDDPGSGNSAVRIVHGSADAPTVAVDVGDDATPEVTDFERFEDTESAGIPLPAGNEIQIAIWAGSPLAKVTVFTTPQLPEGGELFVIATGLLARLPREADGFSLLAVGPTGAIGFIKQNPLLVALHASPDAPAVDIYAGSAKLVDNIGFGDLSGAVQVPPGSYTLDFKATGTAGTAASATTPSLTAGARYLAVASGYLASGSPAFQLIPLEEVFSTSANDPLVRVVHASPIAPAVDVGPVSGSDITPIADYTNLAFGESSTSDGTALPLGALTVGIAATGTTSPVATFDLTTVSGLRAFAVAAGSLSGPGEPFRLILVDATQDPWAAIEVMPN